MSSADLSELWRGNTRGFSALRELQRVGVVMAKASVVRDQHQRRKRDTQRREDDVEAECERHLASRCGERRRERHGARLAPRDRAYIAQLR